MRKRNIIILILIVILIGGTGVFLHMKSKIRYNDGFVNGNSAGNLYNAGLFCESNGTVFFANPDDHYQLYSMDLDGKHLKKLCSDTAMYINADSHYIYYVRNNDKRNFAFFTYANNSLCRIPRNGGEPTVLDVDPCTYATLIGNYIYYLHYDKEHATTLYKVGIDGKGKTMVKNPYIFTCSALGQYFYTSGTEKDGALYEFDTTTDQMSKIYDCNCYKPIVSKNDDVYYLDADQDMALIHTNVKFDHPVTLVNDSLDLYNVYGSTIYFQRYSKDDPALCMIKNDGSGYQELASGTFSNINITSTYIYFTDYNTKEVYYTKTDHPGTLTPFHPGTVSR